MYNYASLDTALAPNEVITCERRPREDTSEARARFDYLMISREEVSNFFSFYHKSSRRYRDVTPRWRIDFGAYSSSHFFASALIVRTFIIVSIFDAKQADAPLKLVDRQSRFPPFGTQRSTIRNPRNKTSGGRLIPPLLHTRRQIPHLLHRLLQ